MYGMDCKKNLVKVFDVFFQTVFNELIPLGGVKLDDEILKKAKHYFDIKAEHLIDSVVTSDTNLVSVLPEVMKEAVESTYSFKRYAGNNLDFSYKYIDEIFFYIENKIEDMHWLLLTILFNPEELNDASGYNNIDNIETLVNAVTLVQTLELKDSIQQSDLNNVVLNKVKELLFEIQSSSPSIKLSELESINKEYQNSGAPKKTHDLKQRNRYIQDLLDDGFSETKAFKKASDVFFVSTDSLRKPFKIWQAKQAQLEEALATIKPILKK